MGYDFYGYHRKKDNDIIFHEGCMYAYQPVFKECFGREICDFSGVVTKKTVEEFRIGLEKFKSAGNNNLDRYQMPGYLGNITYEKLSDRLSELLYLMESKQVRYLSIN